MGMMYSIMDRAAFWRGVFTGVFVIIAIPAIVILFFYVFGEVHYSFSITRSQ